eukprot:UN02733
MEFFQKFLIFKNHFDYFHEFSTFLHQNLTFFQQNSTFSCKLNKNEIGSIQFLTKTLISNP